MAINNKWGINKKIFRGLTQLHNRTIAPPHKTDSPDQCRFGADYWNHYPVRDYDYRYNAWGFRSQDFEQYFDQPVNLCIGDSNTVNLGGPVEHSWPSLLSKRFDIPTLNFGADGLCFYDFNNILEKSKKYFKIDKVFVLYNFFDNDQETITNLVQPVVHNTHLDAKINILKQHCWVHGAYWQFDPPWSFFSDELDCLYQHLPEAHDYLQSIQTDYQDVDLALLINHEPLRVNYHNMAGASWIPYEKFCQIVLVGDNVLTHFSNQHDQHMVTEYLQFFNLTLKQMLLTNRDGFHMSWRLNQALADYFYQATIQAH